MMRSPRRWDPAVWFAVVMLAVWTPAAQGQGEFSRSYRDAIGLPDWRPRPAGWIYWWEANRATYIEQAIGPPQPGAAEDPDRIEYRDQAIEALLETTHSEEPLVREGAALALGRIGAEDALPRLIELTETGEEDKKAVRRAAWAAIGLLSSEEARDHLLQDHNGLEEHDAVSRIIALGLLDEPDEQTVEALKEILGNADTPTNQRMMAMWALRALRPPDLRELSHRVIRGVEDQRLAAEAILALGVTRDKRDMDPLRDWASRITGEEFPAAWAARLDRNDPPDLRNRIAPRSESHVTLPIFSLAVRDFKDGLPLSLRSAAAMALGRFGDLPLELEQRNQVREAIKQGFWRSSPNSGLTRGRGRMRNQFGEPFQDPVSYQGPGLIALGRVGDSEDTEFLSDAMVGTVPSPYGRRRSPQRRSFRGQSVREHRDRLSPRARGFAMVASGLYLQHGLQAERVRDRERGLALNHLLRQYVTRGEESAELRAACALALGLAGNRSDAQPLLQAAMDLDRGDELVFGYTLLALGFLGEQRAVDLAERYLGEGAATLDAEALLDGDPPEEEYDAHETLTRRAIVTGLTVLRDERAVPILIGEWGENFWVSTDIARALARYESYDITDALIELTEQEEKPALTVAAVCSLGELFDTDRPSRLSRLCGY